MNVLENVRNSFKNYTATQKKGQELFWRPSKKRYFRVYGGKIWYNYGFQAAEFNNEARLD